MKKLLLILLCLPMIGFGQQLTYIPDSIFEHFLENNGTGNGIANDHYVFTSSIDTITLLEFPSLPPPIPPGFLIYDLTGIEDFTSLTILDIEDHQLTTINLSQNINLLDLHCEGNPISSLNLNTNVNLRYLDANNCLLTSINLTTNSNLERLDLSMNQLTSLDLRQNSSLYDLECDSNYQLSILDLRNGNNTLMWDIEANNIPNLTCISVDDPAWATATWVGGNFEFDSQHYFSNNCPPPSAIQEHTTNKELLKVTDLLGREAKQTNQPLFYIYDDGTVEKRIVIE